MKIKRIIPLLFLPLVIFGGMFMSTNGSNVLETNASTISEDRKVYEIDDYLDETINTFSAWIKLPTTVPDDVPGGIILGNHYYYKSFPGCVDFAIGKNGKFQLFWNLTGYSHIFESYDFRNGKWTNVVLIRDKINSTLKLYVNSILKETVDVDLPDSAAHCKYRIGMDQSSWYIDLYDRMESPFLGDIQQVSLFDDALSSQDVENLFLAGRGGQFTKQDFPSAITNLIFKSWGKTEHVLDTTGQHNATMVTFNAAVPIIPKDDYDYSFVVVPDMQAMTCIKPANFYAQSYWLVENKDKYNIKFAMYMGDMTEQKHSVDPDGSEAEWEIASEAMSILDDELPYTFVLGNHDYDNWAQVSRETTTFNKYMPYSKYSKFSYFGGAYEEGKMDNTYSIIKVGDIEYLIFALEEGPRCKILNWMDRVIYAHPKARVFITTHSYLTPQNLLAAHDIPGSAPSKTITYDDVNDADKMWEGWVSKHPNVVAVFSGHECSDDIMYRRDEGKYGNKVYSFLTDVQGSMLTNCMNTVMLVKVNEKKKTWDICYYWPDMDKCFNVQNQFSLDFSDEFNPTVGLAEK